MHEYSIVQALIESCEEHVKANNATRVTKVVVKIGVMSGVEVHLFEEAFELFKQESICHDCELHLQLQKVKVHCNSCLLESELEENIYLCPQCQSSELDIIDGEDMFLMSLEME